MLEGPAEPILVETAREPLTEGFIEIIDASSGNHVVTVIEMLSPTNKTPGEGMEDYRRKQREICASRTNLVESDLLRGGRHVLAVPRENIPLASRTTHAVCVRPATAPSKAALDAIALSQPLPTVMIAVRARRFEHGPNRLPRWRSGLAECVVSTAEMRLRLARMAFSSLGGEKKKRCVIT